MFRRTDSRMIVIVLAVITAGSIFAVVFFAMPGGGGQTPDLQKTGRPEWLASPSPEQQVKAAKARDIKSKKQRDLVVGIIGPQTGVEARYGEAVLEGITMAVDRFNSHGGLRGEAVKIIHYDNSGGPDQALAMASDLIEKNVVAIFSAPTGWSTFAPTDLVNRSQTVFISVGTRRKIGRSGSYIFRLSLPDEIAIDKLLFYATDKLDYKSFALVNSSSYDYSLSIASAFKQSISKHGGNILVETDTYDTFSGKTDIGKVASVLQANSKKLQAVVFTGDAKGAAQLAKAIKDKGLMIPLVGSEDLFSDEFLKVGGKAVLGSLLYATFAPDRASQKVKDFVKNHVTRKTSIPGRFTALAYDAFDLLSRALVTTRSLSGRAVRDALLNLEESEGVTGSSRWAPDGTPIKYPFLYRVESGQTGEKFVLVQ